MFTNFTENRLLDAVYGRSIWSKKPTNLGFGLLTTLGAEDGTGYVEVTGNGYARKVVPVSGSSWNLVGDGSVSNAAIINWPVATADWGEIKAIGVFNSGTGSTLLFQLQLPVPVKISTYNQFKYDVGGLVLTLTGGAFSSYLSEVVLSYLLRGVAIPNMATLYCGLGTGIAGDVLLGEPLDHGYARAAINNNTTNWSAAVEGTKKSGATTAFAQANSGGLSGGLPWTGPLTHYGLFDNWSACEGSSSQPTAHTIAFFGTGPSVVNEPVVILRGDKGAGWFDSGGNTFRANRLYFARGVTSDSLTLNTLLSAGGSSSSQLTWTWASLTTASLPTIYRCVDHRSAAFVNGSATITLSAGDAGALAYEGSGYKVGDMAILCRADLDGSTPTYPTGLDEGQLYYVVASDEEAGTIQLSATQGGAAITVGSAPSGVGVIRLQTGRLLSSGSLINPLTILAGDIAQIVADSLEITLD